MKVIAKFEDPLDQEVTLTVTMPLGKWMEIKKALGPLTGHWDLYHAIDQIIDKVNATFEAEEPAK